MAVAASLPIELLDILNGLDSSRSGTLRYLPYVQPLQLGLTSSLFSPSQTDLGACGPATTFLLDNIFTSVRQATSVSCSLASTRAASLVRLANEKILSYNYKDVPVVWRRLYTDASLLKVVAGLCQTEGVAEKLWLEFVRELDMVLIVAGAPGPERRDVVFELIRLVQNRLPPSTSLVTSAPSSPNPSRPTKRPKLSPPSLVATPHITNPIPRLSAPPTLDEFISTYLYKPFILTSGCSDWPAVNSWCSKDYLRKLAGPGRVVPVEVGGNYTADDWGQKILPFEDFLESIYTDQKDLENKGERLYLAQHDLFRQFPALERDVVVPDYVFSAPEAPQDMPLYAAPPNEEGFVMNAWLGPEGTLSPAHTDPYFNCFAQVVGSKWIWCAPPAISDFMYTYGSPLQPLPLPTTSSDDDDEPADSASSHMMTNTSRIDVSLPPDSATLARFPAFEEKVVPVAQQAVLEAGDLLFLPPGYWHSLKSLERSFSVSIWF